MGTGRVRSGHLPQGCKVLYRVRRDLGAGRAELQTLTPGCSAARELEHHHPWTPEKAWGCGAARAGTPLLAKRDDGRFWCAKSKRRSFWGAYCL